MDPSAPPAQGNAGPDLRYLVVTNLTALPRRCFVTNELVADSEYQVWDLPYLPRWLWLLTFTTPILLIAAPYAPARCKIKAGLSKGVRRKVLFIRLTLIFLMLFPFILVGAAVIAKFPELMLAAVISAIFPYVALPAFVLLTPPLRVVKNRDAHFYIKGCSPEFLASLSGA
jgi:hypothetical protein